jgi:hypothetical protein
MRHKKGMGRREINNNNRQKNLKDIDKLSDMDVDGKIRTSVVI